MPKPSADNRRGTEAPVPVYYKLQMELMDGIEGGKWGPGEALPPERKLAELYDVSIGTVNRALANLVNAGYLYRMQGKGTFVSGTSIPVESVRYTRLRREFSDVDPKIQIETVGVQAIPGIQPINRYLKIRANHQLWELKRIISIRKKPVHFHISYLQLKRFPGLDDIMGRQFKNATLYLTIEKKFGLPTIFNEELYGAIIADEQIAKILEVEPGSPLLKIQTRSFTYKEQPYEYRLSYVATNDRLWFREM